MTCQRACLIVSFYRLKHSSWYVEGICAGSIWSPTFPLRHQSNCNPGKRPCMQALNRRGDQKEDRGPGAAAETRGGENQEVVGGV